MTTRTLEQKNKKLNLRETIAMAVGTMIGASIFSIFGLGVSLAGNMLPEVFILSGIYASIVVYSYAILGKKIISNAGPIAFILKGLGDGLVTGALSIVMWLSYVISLALFVKGFAGYFLPFVHIQTTALSLGIVEIIVIAFFTLLNFFGGKAVGKSEFYIVLTKILILLIFILAGFLSIHWGRLEPSLSVSHFSGLFHASIIFFVAFMGFGLITNVSENIIEPEKNIPRAMYISVIFVLIFYVLISFVTRNLPITDIVRAQENALAVAAQPFLGSFGFILITLGALFSTSSAMNATLFGGSNISYSLAKDGELPKLFEKKLWFQSRESLYITAGLGLFFALFFDLESIASMTSTIFITIYIAVVFAHLRLRKEYGGNKLLLIINFIILLFVFFSLLYFQWKFQVHAFYTSILVFIGALFLEFMYRKYRNKKISLLR